MGISAARVAKRQRITCVALRECTFCNIRQRHESRPPKATQGNGALHAAHRWKLVSSPSCLQCSSSGPLEEGDRMTPLAEAQTVVQQQLAEHGACSPLELLLATNQLDYDDYQAWRRGERATLDDALVEGTGSAQRSPGDGQSANAAAAASRPAQSLLGRSRRLMRATSPMATPWKPLLSLRRVRRILPPGARPASVRGGISTTGWRRTSTERRDRRHPAQCPRAAPALENPLP